MPQQLDSQDAPVNPDDQADSQGTPGSSDDQQAAPDPINSQNSTVYNAMCDSAHGLQGQWMGPNRADSATAQTDADDHNHKNPGHQATVTNNL